MSSAKRDHRLTILLLAIWALIMSGLVLVAALACADTPRFGGKFELVPLPAGNGQLYQRNGHTYDGERSTITFRTDAGDEVTVFAGETTDGASIPPPLWWFMPPDGPYLLDAAFHDACYKSHGTFDWQPTINHRPVGALRHGRTRSAPYTREECDTDILDAAMRASHISIWRRWLIWDGVRLGGWLGWGR